VLKNIFALLCRLVHWAIKNFFIKNRGHQYQELLSARCQIYTVEVFRASHKSLQIAELITQYLSRRSPGFHSHPHHVNTRYYLRVAVMYIRVFSCWWDSRSFQEDWVKPHKMNILLHSPVYLYILVPILIYLDGSGIHRMTSQTLEIPCSMFMSIHGRVFKRQSCPRRHGIRDNGYAPTGIPPGMTQGQKALN
jgi:hypothetical protein